MKTETKILVGCYRNWSTKTSAQKVQAYRKEAGEDYLEVKAEDVPKATITNEQMIRELQSIFCKGRYRSWSPSSGL
jgi:hypothetical protein